MKVAVCIGGQPRSLVKGHEYISKNLLEPYNPDVFISTWDTTSYIMDNREIRRLYEPTNTTFHRQLEPKFFDKYTNIASERHPAYNTGCMLYQVWKANELKRHHELTKGFRYDIVVKIRFDFALNTKLNLENIEPWKIYVPNCRQTPDHTMCNDQLAWGTSETIDAYSQTFVNADYLYRSGVIYNGEDLLGANLKMYGLVGDRMEYVDVNHPFPPGKYDGLPNSLIRDDFRDWNTLRG